MKFWLVKKNVFSKSPFRNYKIIYLKNKNVNNFFRLFSSSPVCIPKRVGFMKPSFKLNRKAQKYIVNVQWLKNNDTKKLEELCNKIKKDANSFDSYELIDLVYYLSKHSNKNAYLTIEPLLFHFFLKYNKNSHTINLNGISIHRLLRVLTEYQDIVYREWIYSISEIISKKHAHISMRDIQLILDDLALFYDFQIHKHIIPFYKTITNRINELEIKRLPFLIHVIGRIGSNDNKLLYVLFNTLKNNIFKSELYRSDFSGLMLRGLANLKIVPHTNLLYQLYKPIRDNINCTNIKYISWCADGFSRLNFFYPLPLLVNQILKMKDKISQLELNDFSSILNCIQSYILIKYYNNTQMEHNISKHYQKKINNIDKNNSFYSYINDENIIQDHFNSKTQYCNISEPKSGDNKIYNQKDEKINNDMVYNNIYNNTSQQNINNNTDIKHNNNMKMNKNMNYMFNNSNQYDKNIQTTNKNPILEEKKNGSFQNNKYPNNDTDMNFSISIEQLYDIYIKLENIILEKISESIYNSTPPYRVIMFELMTRLFRFYNKPIDLIITMNTHRYDTPILLKNSNSLQLILSNEKNRLMSNSNLSFYVNKFDILNDFFFRTNHKETDEHNMNDHKSNEHNKHCNIEKKSNDIFVNIPLPKIFKTFLHSIYFRTPALGGRTIMLLLIALVRLNFGQREKLEYEQKLNTNILPLMKASEIYRPLTHCIIREIIRKLQTFNSEELIICVICLNELDALNLNKELFSLLIDRFYNLKNNNYMTNDQLAQLKTLFNYWINHKRNMIIDNLKYSNTKQFKHFIRP
ncbi:conserved Plasmodium protein, unknown function [Plasmodium gaboni]|uniref:Heptatricopeptide repeat-containing protein n=1 Tax=Plasmodium gaboni TaxID=647221 RepID=A0ABY1UR64_9APIC|nr:conserved Plasmodium protein, unknown function [Plasmodium gaboni]